MVQRINKLKTTYPKTIKKPNSLSVCRQNDLHYRKLQGNKTLPPTAYYNKSTNKH